MSSVISSVTRGITAPRWLYAVLASIGLIGVSLISYRQFMGQSHCPQFGSAPICYVLLVCFTAVLASALAGETLRKWLFWPGWIGVFAAAALGSSMELAGHVTCPRSGTGVPTCYFSLANSIAILALYIFSRRGSLPT